LAGISGRSVGRTPRNREWSSSHCEALWLGAHAFSGQPWSALHTGGADVKYGLSSNLIAVGTVNTDFSDSDVDQQ